MAVARTHKLIITNYYGDYINYDLCKNLQFGNRYTIRSYSSKEIKSSLRGCRSMLTREINLDKQSNARVKKLNHRRTNPNDVLIASVIRYEGTDYSTLYIITEI